MAILATVAEFSSEFPTTVLIIIIISSAVVSSLVIAPTLLLVGAFICMVSRFVIIETYSLESYQCYFIVVAFFSDTMILSPMLSHC